MAFRSVRVLIVDDSLFFRTALQKALSSDSYIEIVGLAKDAFEAEKMIKELKPDVVTLDVEMPGMRGTDFVKKIMPLYPIPVVLVSSLNISVFEALQSGAIDFVKKPDMSKSGEFNTFSSELSVKVKIASAAKVRKPIILPPVTSNIPISSNIRFNTSNVGQRIVAIGASTGGTEATLEVLKQLPAEFPPIIVTQHMPPGFTKMYADRLDKICQMRVAEAENGMRVTSGLAIIAAGDRHMVLEKDMNGYFVKCYEAEKVSGHCPSVDVLFESVAKKAGAKAIGVILTGMGRDGASGLLSMRKAGAFTVGQDKETCVVYGMPMVANQIGGVVQEAPIQSIASILMKKLGG